MRRFIACILLPSYLAACMTWEVREVSPQQVVDQEQPAEIHVMLTDRSWVIFKGPRISGDSLVGAVVDGAYRGHKVRGGRQVSIYLGDVVQVAVSKKSADPALGAAGVVAAIGYAIYMIKVNAAFSGG